LEASELRKIAAIRLPEATDAGLDSIAEYAKNSRRFCKGVDLVVMRARFIAKQAGRKAVRTADIVRAIEEAVLPSDLAFTQAVTNAPSAPKKKGQVRRAFIESPMQENFSEQDPQPSRLSSKKETLLQGSLTVL
jgi:hypothetical protein